VRTRATLRTPFAALAVLGSIALAAPADAAPPDTDPVEQPETHPALPAQGTAPETGEPPASEPAPPSDEPAFAPMPSLKKNPIDVLPGDVVYPPLDRTPVKPIIWNPEWPRFGLADWVVTGTGAAMAIAAAIIPPQPKHYVRTFGIDDTARNSLRLPTVEGRYIARDASDVILSLEATWPFFVDALISTWWYRGSPDAAAQMALVDGEALAIVVAIQGATNTLVSRERPYGQTCGGLTPGNTNDCEGNVRYRSFFSGHSAFTFMAAGLICVHHQKLDLLRGSGDTIACVTAYAGAAATGLLRVAGDMHYITDVGVGAIVGTAVGLAVPLLHYRRVNLAPKEKPTGIDMHVMPVGAGVGIGGTF
jgi:membrane-associated phospholipid phosphatase